MSFFTNKPNILQAVQWTGSNLAEIESAFPQCTFSVDGNVLIVHGGYSGDAPATVGAWVAYGLESALPVGVMSDQALSAKYQPVSNATVTFTMTAGEE